MDSGLKFVNLRWEWTNKSHKSQYQQLDEGRMKGDFRCATSGVIDVLHVGSTALCRLSEGMSLGYQMRTTEKGRQENARKGTGVPRERNGRNDNIDRRRKN